MLLLRGPEHAALLGEYLENHELVRGYGRAADLASLAELRHDVEAGDTVPLVWNDPISMDLGDFLDLKDLIREHCPATKSWSSDGAAKTYNKYFNSQPQWFDECHKTGYPWPEVPENLRL